MLYFRANVIRLGFRVKQEEVEAMKAVLLKVSLSYCRKLCTIALLTSLSLFITGCSHLRFPAAFKIDVAQGNILEVDKVKQLQPGMTQRQVVYLLGSPVMRDPFQPSVWNYVYQFSRRGQAPNFYRLELVFDKDILRVVNADLDQIKVWHKKHEPQS